MKEFNFEELFGFEFGTKTKEKVTPTREESDYLIHFKTPNHSEEDVRFFLDTVLWRLMGDVTLTILDAEDDNRFMFSDKRSLSMFVNKDGVDPKAGRASGHPWIPTKTRTTHLLPNHNYTLSVYRPRHDDRQPLGISYYGDDKNQVDYGIEPEDDGIEVTIAGTDYIMFEK